MTSDPLIAALAALVTSAHNQRMAISDLLANAVPYPELQDDFYNGHPEEYAA